MLTYGMISYNDQNMQNINIKENSQEIIKILNKIESLINETLDNQNNIQEISLEEMIKIGIQTNSTMKPVADNLGKYFQTLKIKFSSQSFYNLINILHYELKKQMNIQYAECENIKLNQKDITTPQHRTNLYNIILTKLLTILCVSYHYQQNENKENLNNISNVLMNQNSANNIFKITFLDKVKADYGYDIDQIQNLNPEFIDKEKFLSNFKNSIFITQIQKLIKVYINSSQSFSYPAMIFFNRHVDATQDQTANFINSLQGDQKNLSLLMISFIYNKYPSSLIQFLYFDLTGNAQKDFLSDTEYNKFIKQTENESFLENELNYIISNPQVFQDYIKKPIFRNEDFKQNLYNLDEVLKNKDKYINMQPKQLQILIKQNCDNLSKEYINIMKNNNRKIDYMKEKL